jgi:hypothetical protein
MIASNIIKNNPFKPFIQYDSSLSVILDFNSQRLSQEQ